MLRFEKSGTEFQFWTPTGCLYATERLAFIVDREQGCFLKHGPVERISAYYTYMQAAYQKMGFGRLAQDIQMIEASEWPIEELNNILNTTGYIGRYLDQIENGVQ